MGTVTMWDRPESKPVGQERARRQPTNPLPPQAFPNGGQEPQGGPAGGCHPGPGVRWGALGWFAPEGVLVLGLSVLRSSEER